MWVERKPILVRLVIVLILAEDRHTVRRMYHGHGNHFGHTRWYTLGDVGQVKACFGPFGDRVNLSS
jgi:hypothetical protein